MRNANDFDIEKINSYGYRPQFGVVYKHLPTGDLVHMKNYYGNSPLEYGVFIMENTDDSVLRFVRRGELGAIP